MSTLLRLFVLTILILSCFSRSVMAQSEWRQGNALLAIGDSLLSASQYDLAYEQFEAAATQGQQNGDTLAYLYALNRMGKTLWEGYRYQEAKALIDSAKVEIMRYELARHPLNADRMMNQAGVFDADTKFEECLAILDEALIINTRWYGDDHPQVAKVWQGKGNMNLYLGNLQEASSQLSRAWQILKRVDGEVPSKVAVLLDLAEYSGMMGDFVKMAEMINTAKALLEGWPDNHPIYLAVRVHEAWQLSETDRLEESLTMLKDVLQKQEALFGKSSRELVATLNELIWVYQLMGQVEPLTECSERMVSIYRSVHGDQHPDTWGAVAELAMIYEWGGKTNTALELIEPMISNVANLNLAESAKLQEAFFYVAVLFRRTGDSDRALSLQAQVLNATEQTYGPDHPASLASLSEMASAQINLGMIEEALAHTDRALEILNHHEDQKMLARISMDRAIALIKAGRYDESVEAVDQGMGIFRDVPDSLRWANAMWVKAKAYYYAGQLNQAISTYKKTEELFERLSTRDKGLAITLDGLAHCYFKLDQFDSSLHYASKAELANRIAQESPSSDDSFNWRNLPVQINLKTIQAAAYLGKYKNTNSLDDLTLAHKAIVQADSAMDYMRATQTRFEDRVNLTDQRYQLYDYAISIGYEMEQAGLENEKGAFYFVEKSKSAVLGLSLLEGRAKSFARIPEDIIQLEQELKNDLAKNHSAMLSANPDNARMLHIQFEASKQRLDSLQFALERDFPRYHQLKYTNQLLSSDQVRSLLESNEALIEYHESDSLLFVFTLTRTETWIDVLVKDSTAIQLIDRYHKFFERHNLNADPLQVYLHYSNAAHQLYKELLEPAVQHLNSQIDHLIIIADGSLSTIPFDHLLTQPSNDSNPDYRNLSYLIRTFAISYANSANLLFQSDEREPQSNSKSVLALAPSYGPDLLATYRATERSVPKDALFPLKWNISEVKAIGELFPGTFYSGEEATEAHFKAEADQHKVIHIAAHAWVDDEDPMLSRFFFSNEQDSIEDGRLHAYELFAMDLPAQMAVLSACNTGLGDLRRGEGVMSLARAFAYAGCPSVVMSHWSVDDKSTSELMAAFYRHIADGLPKDEALRQAKLDFLETASPLNSHPYYWGGFVVLGNTSPLSSDSNRMWWWLVAAFFLLSAFVVTRKWK